MATTTPNYEINYDDERFGKVESDYQAETSEIDKTYGDMISNSDQYYDDLIQQSKDWADKQSQLQQEQTDHTIDQINQQKDQAQKDYVKEQSGAYQDWQKQSNAYGTEAEKMASSGLRNTGYSESSQVSMYNTYQNRVATAREAFSRAVLNYDNAIKDAQLQNNSVLAEIAATALEKQTTLALEGFQYNNNLIIEQTNKKTEANNRRWDRYLAVLGQINTENALAEDVRQFNETMEFNTTQAELNRQHESNENALDRQHQSNENALNREFQAKESELNRQFEANQAELDRKHQSERDELDRQHDFALLNAQTKAEKELLDKQHQQAMAKLAQQQKYEKELLAQQHAQDMELLEKQQQQAKVVDDDEDIISEDIYAYYDRMVSAGYYTKSQVNAEITKKLKAGELTQEQANKLREIYNPRGYTY